MRCPPLLFLSLFLLGCVLDVSVANNVVDCCLRTSENHIPWRIVQDYRLQLVQDGCIIPATVFITMKGKRLCAPLEAPWVIRLRERLDASSPRKVRASLWPAPAQLRGCALGPPVGRFNLPPSEIFPVWLGDD
uniref:C-C motif chemokine 19-like n=1 Tax=Nothoprocta perdicaria TaxID=30464 RepID=A0A8C6YZ96_NOTPE